MASKISFVIKKECNPGLETASLAKNRCCEDPTGDGFNCDYTKIQDEGAVIFYAPEIPSEPPNKTDPIDCKFRILSVSQPNDVMRNGEFIQCAQIRHRDT